MTVRRHFPRLVSPRLVSIAALLTACFLSISLPHSAAGQTALTNIIPQDAAITAHAKITALDLARRQVTLTGQSGARVTVQAAPAVRLEMLKVGDVVDAQYHRSVAFLIFPPNTAAPEGEIERTIARPADVPGGLGVQAARVGGLVVGVAPGAHSLHVVDPTGGAVFTVNVTDPDRQAALPKLKVGGIITAVINEALAVTIQPATKGLF